jgi:hypothetical protein
MMVGFVRELFNSQWNCADSAGRAVYDGHRYVINKYVLNAGWRNNKQSATDIINKPSLSGRDIPRVIQAHYRPIKIQPSV